MTFTLPPGEPAAGPWRPRTVGGLLDDLRRVAGPVVDRPLIVAVDGRGASGKSTLASALKGCVARSAVVHTDDLAWHEPFFGWSRLLAEVLRPLRAGRAVHLRPPAWDAHDRLGHVDVPAGSELVVVEGTGAAPREFAHLIDATVWVQSDFAEAERRGIERDLVQGVNGDESQTVAFWHEWMGHELRWFDDQRPWERADLVVTGTSPIPLTDGELATAHGPLRGQRVERRNP